VGEIDDDDHMKDDDTEETPQDDDTEKKKDDDTEEKKDDDTEEKKDDDTEEKKDDDTEEKKDDDTEEKKDDDVDNTGKEEDAKEVAVLQEESEARPHPHMGARDADGKLGYVHDAAALHTKGIPWDDRDTQKICRKGGQNGNGDADWRMLTQKVEVDLTGHREAEERAAEFPRAKIFCVVYTVAATHDRIPAILETWGQKCDGFMVASTKTDTDLYTVEIPHQGDEHYQNIWQKVRSIWSYIYDNYADDYDFFHIGGDDLYLIVENLRLYLESEEILKLAGGAGYPQPIFLGRRFQEQGNKSLMFNSGGSGYTMNRAALKALVVDQMPKEGVCGPHLRTFAEDVMVARCFRHMGLVPYDTLDYAQGERYMPFTPGAHFQYTPPKVISMQTDWYPVYTPHKLVLGLDHCAKHSVAFHYIKGDLMRRIHAILYGHCPK